MKTNDKPISSKQRIISRCVLSALALLGAADAVANKQFAAVPLYLDKATTSTGVKVKPNVMLLIDDSGSMKWVLDEEREPRSGERSRMDVTKEALKMVLNKYQDKINWGFQTLHNNNQPYNPTDRTCSNNSYDAPNYPGYTEKYTDILNRVDRLCHYNGTPTTRRYHEVSKIVRDNTLYRCQKNYIVLLSDGDANDGFMGKWKSQWNGKGEWKWNDRIRNYEYKYEYEYVPGETWRVFPAADIFVDDYFGTRHAGTLGWKSTNSSSDMWDTVFDRDNGLGWFSNTLATKDFKASGSDRAGKSWNGDSADPKDASGRSIYEKQLVETYTVGFGKSISPEGRVYLEKGASKLEVGSGYHEHYFDATTAEGLVNAFGKIFSNINAANAPIAIEGAGSTAPALTNPANRHRRV